MLEPTMGAGRMRRVLLTGAAGRIGTALRAQEGERYAWRFADRAALELTHTGDHEAMTFDLTDLDACRRACEGMEVVVHLGGDPSPDARFYESLLPNNI